MAAESQKLAWAVEVANERYATDYPAAVGSHMTNTDSGPFQDLIPAISLRENERGVHIGSGWDPQWHQPTDVFATYNDKDFRLGLNAAQTTLGAVGQLTRANLKRGRDRRAFQARLGHATASRFPPLRRAPEARRISASGRGKRIALHRGRIGRILASEVGDDT